MTIFLFVLAALAALSFSAFFSGTETGFLSVSRERILHLAREGGRKAKIVQNALSDMGVSTSEAILMGDQVFTDVWAGKRLGMRAFIVPPIKDKKNLFFRCKRWIEKPFLRAYYKKKGK